MSKIMDNLEKVHVAVVLEKFKNKDKQQIPKYPFSEALGAAAVKAIMGGIISTDWKNYMSLFADNETQLTLLTESPDTEEGYLKTARAYIVANAVCGAGTTGETAQNVDPQIDNNLSSEVSATLNKSLKIPEDLLV